MAIRFVLGLFRFAAYHIRRNDLQYKEVFLSAEASYTNTEALLLKKELIYIATDETDPDFFAPFAEQHTVYRWADFFTEKGNFALKNVEIPPKWIGLIEQVICASARVFVGTKKSTFSAYIPRLRGYLRAPDTATYYHTSRYNRPKRPPSKFNHRPVIGNDYMADYPTLWLDV